jgi:hypothetical protein
MIPNPRPQVKSKIETATINNYISIGDMILIDPPMNAWPDSVRVLCSKCEEGFCYMPHKWVGWHILHGGYLCSQCKRLIEIKYCIGKGRGEIGVHDYKNLIGTESHVEINSYTKKADDHYYIYKCKKCKVLVTIPVKVIEITKQYYGSFMVDLDFGDLTESQKNKYIPILLRWLSPDQSDQIKDKFHIKLWRSYHKEYDKNKQIWLMDAACY